MASGGLLLGYHDAVHEQTVRYVQGLTGDGLARVVEDAAVRTGHVQVQRRPGRRSSRIFRP